MSSIQHLGHTYTTMLFDAYLKFEFNQAFCFVSGNPGIQKDSVLQMVIPGKEFDWLCLEQGSTLGIE